MLSIHLTLPLLVIGFFYCCSFVLVHHSVVDTPSSQTPTVTKTKAYTMVIKVDDHAKICGGSTHLGKIGLVLKKTKVMASLLLDETGMTVSKKHKFLEKISTPPKGTKTKNVLSNQNATENVMSPPTAVTNDILITVPFINNENMNSLLQSATEAIETISGQGTLNGKGLVLRGMGQIKFKFKSTDKALVIISYFQESPLKLEGQTCTVSFAEPAVKLSGKKRRPLGNRNHYNYSHSFTRDDEGQTSQSVNKAAYPAGRSLFDRLQGEPVTKKSRNEESP